LHNAGGWLCNPSGVKFPLIWPFPRVRFATLGCGVQPLRGKTKNPIANDVRIESQMRNFKKRTLGYGRRS